MENGFRLRECREERGYTQTDIAKVLSCTREAVSQYENGKREIPITALCKLADFYKCTTDELLGSSYYYAYIAMRDER